MLSLTAGQYVSWYSRVDHEAAVVVMKAAVISVIITAML